MKLMFPSTSLQVCRLRVAAQALCSAGPCTSLLQREAASVSFQVSFQALSLSFSKVGNTTEGQPKKKLEKVIVATMLLGHPMLLCNLLWVSYVAIGRNSQVSSRSASARQSWQSSSLGSLLSSPEGAVPLCLVQAHLQVAKTLRHLAMAYPIGAPERKDAVERALPILYREVRCMMSDTRQHSCCSMDRFGMQQL